ncbi:hypothetical protein T10_8720 [Trichinella papuae]|uniref:Uncharacterized protein n=1 Tax=Trichinella papuae TaxID=268474 RepID=A0A0V1MBC5_9BILA|nr:hypothetical protein T10_8720 [Trichinella papuae]
MSAVEKLRNSGHEKETQKTATFLNSAVEIVCGFCQKRHTFSECSGLRQAIAGEAAEDSNPLSTLLLLPQARAFLLNLHV